METNYLDIEALVHQAQQDRSKAVGNMLAASWEKCKKLFRAHGTGQTVVWRVLPP